MTLRALTHQTDEHQTDEHQTDEPLSDAQLADEIVTWSGRLAAGEARLLALLAEFDRREAWAGPGLLSCAHWLAWRTGLRPGAAREKVRVARALAALPVTRAAFTAGRLSFSQARAVTRAATASDEQTWVDLCQHSTAGQLERLVRGVRRARRAEQDARDPEGAAHRMLAITRYDEDGTLVLTVRLPAQQGAVLLAAVEQARADLDRARGEQPDDVSAETPTERAPSATVAEGLLEMARAALERTAREHPAAARAGRSGLVALVDPLTGSGRLHDGELVPSGQLPELAAPPPLSTSPRRPAVGLRAAAALLPGRQGQEARQLGAVRQLRHEDLGRSRRRPSQALRDLLGALDGERCRFPGCTRHRRLHAHHVQRWSDGGATDLANLLLLCSRHHVLVHRDGFVLALRPDRSLRVATAAGSDVPPLPALPWRPAAELDPGGHVSAETCPPVPVDRLDLGYAVMVLLQQAA
jgi:Domain of unknown function (DUF222)/HNH endonuclease